MYGARRRSREWLAWLASDAAPALVIGLFIIAVASGRDRLSHRRSSSGAGGSARKWRAARATARLPIDRAPADCYTRRHTPADQEPSMRNAALAAAAVSPAGCVTAAVRRGRQRGRRRRAGRRAPQRRPPADRQLRLRRRRHGPQRRARATTSTITPTAIGTGPPKSPPTARNYGMFTVLDDLSRTRTRDDPRRGGARTRLAGSAISTRASWTRPRSTRRAWRRSSPGSPRIQGDRRTAPSCAAEAGPPFRHGRHRAVQRLRRPATTESRPR